MREDSAPKAVDSSRNKNCLPILSPFICLFFSLNLIFSYFFLLSICVNNFDMHTSSLKKVGGVWTPPFLADVICEQPLMYTIRMYYTAAIPLRCKCPDWYLRAHAQIPFTGLSFFWLDCLKLSCLVLPDGAVQCTMFYILSTCKRTKT